jgi:hypothetical protein
MPDHPNCQNKIWKYDWSPIGQRSKNRKSWRMIVIVPDPDARPLHLIAAAVYGKNSTDQLTAKKLASILAKITGVDSAQPPHEAPERFKHVLRGDGVFVSVCVECGETVAESPHPAEMFTGEEKHECSGPITA